MDLMNLKTKERYLFCEQYNNGNERYFRATFLGIHVYGVQQFTTMICYHESDDIDDARNRIVYHMDAPNSIIMAETLVTLMENHSCKLPDDVLGVINGFW
jgi:hypothetical protein